jgi:hypothetical protein
LTADVRDPRRRGDKVRIEIEHVGAMTLAVR